MLDIANQTHDPPAPGSYTLDSLIGHGGMGEVWLGRAWLAKGLSQRRAIKRLLPTHAADLGARRRFFVEAKASLQLQHPNIVRVYDFTEIDEQECLVMEWIQGVNLAELLAYCQRAKQPLAIDVAVYIAIKVLSALDYTHNFSADGVTPSGLLHRDVSPHNILLSTGGEVKLSDFGIARLTDSNTTTGGPKGKLAYMAPEQLHKTCDARVDLYSIGVVLFEMLAGEPYQHSGTKSQANERSLVVERLELEGITPDLAQVVATLVQHDVDLRYGNATLALNALVRCNPRTCADPREGLAAIVRAAYRPRRLSGPNAGGNNEQRSSLVARKLRELTSGATRKSQSRPDSEKLDEGRLASSAGPPLEPKSDSTMLSTGFGLYSMDTLKWAPRVMALAIAMLTVVWFLMVSHSAEDGSKQIRSEHHDTQ